MSTIPTSLTEKAFDEHIRPYLSVAKRGYESSIPLSKSSTTFSISSIQAVNGRCFRSGLQKMVPDKKKSVIMRFITIIVSGARMAALKKSGGAAF